jgi:hypothetical protein
MTIAWMLGRSWSFGGYSIAGELGEMVRKLGR